MPNELSCTPYNPLVSSKCGGYSRSPNGILKVPYLVNDLSERVVQVVVSCTRCAQTPGAQTQQQGVLASAGAAAHQLCLVYTRARARSLAALDGRSGTFDGRRPAARLPAALAE